MTAVEKCWLGEDVGAQIIQQFKKYHTWEAASGGPPPGAYQPSGDIEMKSTLPSAPPGVPVVCPKLAPLVPTHRSTVHQDKTSLSDCLDKSAVVPISTLIGLTLAASGQTSVEAERWASHTTAKARSLVDVTTLDVSTGSVHLGTLSDHCVNDLASGGTSSQPTHYLPVSFEGKCFWQWALIDEGAQVSMISMGLAEYLNLVVHDFGNILPADL